MKVSVLIAFIFVPISTFAQIGSVAPPPPLPSDEANMPEAWGARYFHFGLNFTPGIYWPVANSSNNTANGASFGYGYGANLEFYFTRNYAFLTGFEISEIGAKYVNTIANPTQSTLDSIITHNESIQYLEIPLELKLKTVPFRNIRYFGVVGLNLGFRLKATDDYSSVVSPYNPLGYIVHFSSYSGNNSDISSQTDFFRVSLVIGGGVEYQLAGSTALQASLTYNNSFTNLNNTSSTAVNIKGIELMLGILF